MSTITVDPSDVVRLILQHLRENGLERSARVLQEESGIAFNSVASKAAIRSAVLAGQWEDVLTYVGGWWGEWGEVEVWRGVGRRGSAQVGQLSLPMETLMDLYEHVVRELLELREGDAALQLLGNATPLRTMRREQPSRFALLDRCVRGGFYDPTTLYGGMSVTRDHRRAELADAILAEVRGLGFCGRRGGVGGCGVR
jgi:LisH-like dimerisation domain